MNKFIHSDGSLRVEGRCGVVTREGYRGHCAEIRTTQQLRATLRAGKYTSLGSYPVYLYTSDGAALCFDCAREEYRQVSRAIREKASDGWRVVGCDVNYESTDLYCDQCNKSIESAYGS